MTRSPPVRAALLHVIAWAICLIRILKVFITCCSVCEVVCLKTEEEEDFLNKVTAQLSQQGFGKVLCTYATKRITCLLIKVSTHTSREHTNAQQIAR